MKVECSDRSIIFIDKEKGKASEGLNRFLQCTVSESFLFVCFKDLFIYGCAGSSLLCRLFLYLRQEGFLCSSSVRELPIVWWLLLLWRQALGHVGFSSFGFELLVQN